MNEVVCILAAERMTAVMEERVTVMLNKKPAYDIVYGTGFEALPSELDGMGISSRRICIVTDSHVKGLYADMLKNLLCPHAKQVDVFEFPAGEAFKTLDTVRDLYAFLIAQHYDRKDLLVALGGGVVGDVTGYAAATYLRGIDFIQVPTTLIAQSDSSIGGKTGVDFDGYKNMVGAFYMPRLVYMNIETLKTLDDRQFYSGFAEVMKHGLIRDALFYEWLLEHMYEIHERDTETLKEMVMRSCTVKKLIVEKDPLEKGDRALLNFGHTIGHAIEKYKNFELSHGESIALGFVAAAYISWKRELLTMEEYYEIRDMLVPFNLPISIDHIDPEQIVALTKSDKKMEHGTIRFILLKKIGKAMIDTSVTEQEMLDAVREIYFDEEDERA